MGYDIFGKDLLDYRGVRTGAILHKDCTKAEQTKMLKLLKKVYNKKTHY